MKWEGANIFSVSFLFRSQVWGYCESWMRSMNFRNSSAQPVKSQNNPIFIEYPHVMRNGLGKFIFGISRLGRGFACGTRTKDIHLNWFRLRSFCTCRIYQSGSSTCWPTLRSLVSLDGSRKPRFSNKLNTNNRSESEKVSDELKTTMVKCETHSDPVRWCMGRVLESQRGLRLSSSAGSRFSSLRSW